jgi:hypothetical protein
VLEQNAPDNKIHVQTPDNAAKTTNIFDFKNVGDFGIFSTSSIISDRGNTLDFYSRDYNTGGGITTRPILTLRPERNIGIGATSLSEKLYVNGTTYFNGASTVHGLLTLPNIILGSNGKIDGADDYHDIQISQPTDTLTIQEYGTISLNYGPTKTQRAFINPTGLTVANKLTVSGEINNAVDTWNKRSEGISRCYYSSIKVGTRV